ncbi:MAG: carbon-nitrogen hydrolase family protein [Eubacterium sp.]|jgi:omega-amidase
MDNCVKVSLLQMAVGRDEQANLEKARKMVLESSERGAQIAVLPEMFICPYSHKYMPQYAEERGGRAYSFLSACAREAGVVLVGGSIPERDGGKLYNTSFVFDQNGNEIARHRKVHLFDADVKGGIRFFESEIFTPGDELTLFSAYGHRFGLCICFDIRFPEIFRLMALKGAEAVFVPASFNMTTGPMHWELSFRMRAVDNQLFTVGVAPARDENGHYVSYANSIACSPWGKVICRAGTAEGISIVQLDFDEVTAAREQLPILNARKPDFYRKYAVD